MTVNPIVRNLAAVLASRTPAWIYVVTLLPSCLIVALSAFQPWVTLDSLMLDPIVVVSSCISKAATLIEARDCPRLYSGFISNLGILIWCASAAICLFAFPQVYYARGRIGPGLFLLYAGLLSGILLVDDLFLGHERIYPKYLGLDQRVTLVLYAAMLAFYLIQFRDDIIKNDAKILLICIVFFAISVVYDLISGFINVVEEDTNIHRAVEDGSKFIAIWAWAVFHIRAAWACVPRRGV